MQQQQVMKHLNMSFSFSTSPWSHRQLLPVAQGRVVQRVLPGDHVPARQGHAVSITGSDGLGPAFRFTGRAVPQVEACTTTRAGFDAVMSKDGVKFPPDSVR